MGWIEFYRIGRLLLISNTQMKESRIRRSDQAHASRIIIMINVSTLTISNL
jgi:hypothetical protein